MISKIYANIYLNLDQREHLIYAQKISKPGKKNKGNSILGTGYGMQRQGLGPAGSENSKFTAASM